MIKSELYKLWSRRSFLLFLAVLILVNTGVNIYESSHESISLSSYKELDDRLEGMSESEKQGYIEEELERIQAIDTIDTIRNYEAIGGEINTRIAENLMSENQDNYNKYFSLWQSGEYLEFTDGLYDEMNFWADIYERYQKTSDYESYLDSIASQGQKQSQISIFGGTDDNTATFSSRNITSVMNQYKKLQGTQTEFYTYAWVDRVLSGTASDLLIFVFIFLIAGILIYEEKKKSLMGLLRSTPGGRTRCIISKLVAQSISVLAVTVTFYLSNVIFYGFVTGLNGWNCSIQSVPEYLSCPFNMTTSTFVGVNVLMKSIVFVGAALLLIIIAVTAANFMWVFITGAAAMGISMLLYTNITSVAKYNWLHYCNWWGFLRTDRITGTYYNLNLFGYPVSTLAVFFTLNIVVILLLTVANVAVYANKRNFSIKKLTVKLPQMRDRHICRSIAGHETYRIMFMYGGIVAFLLYGFIMLWQADGTDIYLTPNQTSYANQMEELIGKLTDEKAEKLNKTKSDYEVIEQSLEEVDAQYAEGTITEKESDVLKMQYQNQLAFYPAFERVYDRYLNICNNSEAGFVYEEGYNMLLGLTGNSGLKGYFLLSIVLIIVGIPVFCYDRERGMHMLIRTTPGGRKRAFKARITVIMAYSFMILLVYEITQIYVADKCFGLSCLRSSVTSLAGFEGFPAWMPIWAMVVLDFLIRYLVVLLLAAVILFISARSKAAVQGMLTAAAILLIPLLLVNFGLNVMQYFSLYYLFSWIKFIV